MATNLQEQIAKDITNAVIEKTLQLPHIDEADKAGEWAAKVYTKILQAVVAANK